MSNGKEINLRTLLNNWKKLVIMTAVFSVGAFFASLAVNPEYGSETQILILQKNIDIDAYRATKSSEFAGEILKQVITSSDFMTGVLGKVGENNSKYGGTQEDQMGNWNKAVRVSTLGSTGIIKIETSDQSREEDKKITEAIVDELLNNGFSYHGNENIVLKKINGPIYLNDPIFPVIWLNVAVATIGGMFFSIGVIFILQLKKT
jgi:capsular polysaccharide biosynthesis protein